MRLLGRTKNSIGETEFGRTGSGERGGSGRHVARDRDRLIFGKRRSAGTLVRFAQIAASSPYEELPDMSLNDLSVSKKLTFSFAGVVSILLVMCVGVFVSLTNVKGATADNEKGHAELTAETAALNALVEQQNAVRGFQFSQASQGFF